MIIDCFWPKPTFFELYEKSKKWHFYIALKPSYLVENNQAPWKYFNFRKFYEYLQSERFFKNGQFTAIF